MDPVSGSFPLIVYNGDTLPVNEFELSNREGEPIGCWSVLTSGTLTLEMAGRFTIEQTSRNSCSNEVLANYSTFGTYEQKNRRLFFSLPRVEPPLEIRFEGFIRESSIEVVNRSPFDDRSDVSSYQM